MFFGECYGDHRDLHVLTHSFPTRRASDLLQLGHRPLHRARIAHIDDQRRHTPLKSGKFAFLHPQISHHDIAAMEIGRAHAELQSLMSISYAVFSLKKKKPHTDTSNSTKTCTTSTNYQNKTRTKTKN